MNSEKGINDEEFLEVANTIQSLKTTISLLSKQLKTLEKNVKKNEKKLQKKANKKKTNNQSKKSGFASPLMISEELREFMGLDPDKKIPRTEVTKYLINYIKEHNLQDSVQKQQINPDSTLQELLKLKKEESLTYFSMQKHMNQHFIK